MTDNNAARAKRLTDIWLLTSEAVYKALTSGEPLSAAMLGECRRFLESNNVSLETLDRLLTRNLFGNIDPKDMPRFTDDDAGDQGADSSPSAEDPLRKIAPFRKP